jgi:spermidine/putrescine transport system substrate-binding protein
MLGDAQEIGNFGLLLTGVNPADSTKDDRQAAADKLREQRDAALVRAYYEQDFIQPLTNGDVWLAMAWSGDIFQQNVEEGANLKFIVPEEGATLWTDNMMIPVTSEAPVDALKLMDYFYDPEVAASLASYINYIPPAPEVKDVLADWAAEADDDDEKAELEELVASSMVFPSEADYGKLHSYVALEPGEEEEFTSLFHAITQA